MPTTRSYVGFSTVGAERTRSWTLYDVDLVKRDLLNHFNTRIGERIGRPSFGCRIWDMLEENMTQGLRQEIINEAVRICAEDPRVWVTDIFLFDFANGIRIEITLDFLGLASNQNFQVLFVNDQRK